MGQNGGKLKPRIKMDLQVELSWRIPLHQHPTLLRHYPLKQQGVSLHQMQRLQSLRLCHLLLPLGSRTIDPTNLLEGLRQSGLSIRSDIAGQGNYALDTLGKGDGRNKKGEGAQSKARRVPLGQNGTAGVSVPAGTKSDSFLP